MQSPYNPRVRSSDAGSSTFTGNVGLDPISAANQMAADVVQQTIAEQAAGRSGRSLEGNIRNLRRRAQVGVGRTLRGLGQAASGAVPALEEAGAGAGRLLGAVGKTGLIGGGAVLAGVPDLMKGDIAGAAGSSGGAVIGGMLGAPLGLPGIAVGSFLGSTIGGGLVHATEAALEKTPAAVSIPTPFGDLPLNASAQQLKYMQQLGDLGATQYRNALGTQTSALIDLNKKILEEDYVAKQREFPLAQAEQNADLARSQALINTQNNAYMQQMVLGSASNLMLDAQRERGAFMRQAISTNPYVTALAAPNVSIG